jgi:chemotaxis protein CheX
LPKERKRMVPSDHTECVAEATSQIITATCGAEIEPLSEQDIHASGESIVGVITLVGDVEWSLLFGMPSDTAVAACYQFAGFDIPFESTDMGDAIGELTNMLAGQIKINLDQKGLAADISLPSVIRSEDLTSLVQGQELAYSGHFSSDLGKFWTGISVMNPAA